CPVSARRAGVVVCRARTEDDTWKASGNCASRRRRRRVAPVS
ncbi:hypothetical protein A2U01_0080396, partial [Trifolium medium]|nr:hypothetical protein [Trifolium medium]